MKKILLDCGANVGQTKTYYLKQLEKLGIDTDVYPYKNWPTF